MRSTNRIHPKAGWVNPASLPKGPNGRACCRYCRQEVPPGRRTFCGQGCVHEWKLRTRPSYARRFVWYRDHGVCAKCGFDTKTLKGAIKPNRLHGRTTGSSHWRDLGFLPNHTLWEMDHITPVAEGGGCCGLDNYQTLCIRCHLQKTAELRQVLSARRLFKKLRIAELPVPEQIRWQLQHGLLQHPEIWRCRPLELLQTHKPT